MGLLHFSIFCKQTPAAFILDYLLKDMFIVDWLGRLQCFPLELKAGLPTVQYIF